MPDARAFSVQYHPEASPGPHERATCSGASSDDGAPPVTLGELQDRLLGWAGAEPRQPWLLEARAHLVRAGRGAARGGQELRPPNERPPRALPVRVPARRRESHARALPSGRGRGAHDRRAGAGPRLGRSRLRPLRGAQLPARGSSSLEEIPGEARHEVVERRSLVALAKGDILEARLLPHEGKLHFSRAFVYHPREVRKAILKEAKRRSGAALKGGRRRRRFPGAALPHGAKARAVPERAGGVDRRLRRAPRTQRRVSAGRKAGMDFPPRVRPRRDRLHLPAGGGRLRERRLRSTSSAGKNNEIRRPGDRVLPRPATAATSALPPGTTPTPRLRPWNWASTSPRSGGTAPSSRPRSLPRSAPGG